VSSTWWQPRSVSPNSLCHDLQVNLSVTRSRPPSASPYPLPNSLQVHLWVQLNLGLQVHLQTDSIAASKHISQFTRPRPPSASLSSLNHRLQVLLWLSCSIICSQTGRMYIYRET
jgi:hypothetical protein